MLHEISLWVLAPGRVGLFAGMSSRQLKKVGLQLDQTNSPRADDEVDDESSAVTAAVRI
jgi:hypothetical protein